MSTPNNNQNNRKSLIYTSRSTLVGSDSLNEEVDFKKSQAFELERLEQEITLTLQDIDRNLSKSNKIINDALIPIIQSYSKNSRKLWEGTKFWKEFFEDSADVQISGVEDSLQKGNEIEGEGDQAAEESGAFEYGESTEGESILHRYYNQVNHGQEGSSTIIKSTPRKSQYESSEIQPPSSPPLSQSRDQTDNVTTSAIFNNIDKEGEISLHKAYKVKLTPNKRPKKGVFDDSPNISPPRLTSFSPVKKNGSNNPQLTDDSIQLSNSPPRTMSFVKSQEYTKKTPSREVAKTKTNDLQELVGANDSSLQAPPQFTLTNLKAPNLQDGTNNDSSVQQEPPRLTPANNKDFELDSILDEKYNEFKKQNDIDWSDDE